MINVKALYACVDKDKNGSISEEEWISYWKLVRQSGYTNDEIR